MADKKKEIVNTCLHTFVEHGLMEISMRDLGEACGMDVANIYHYFENKDKLVIACANEAAFRIEDTMFAVAVKYIRYPDKIEEHLREQAVELRPIMDFYVSVCVAKRYKEAMKSGMLRISQRYGTYIEKIAKMLDCDAEEIAPCVYIAGNTMLSYMLFGEDNFQAPQLDMVKKTLEYYSRKKVEHGMRTVKGDHPRV